MGNRRLGSMLRKKSQRNFSQRYNNYLKYTNF